MAANPFPTTAAAFATSAIGVFGAAVPNFALPRQLNQFVPAPFTSTAPSARTNYMEAEGEGAAKAAGHADHASCYLTAIIGDKHLSFSTAREKFDALAESWDDYNLGRSVLDYHDFAMQQIIGMGRDAVPFLLERVEAGASEWIYALKSITGREEDSPDIAGDEESVVAAWVEWGKRDAEVSRQARQHESLDSTLLPKSLG